jgi:predicted dehydrogenase
VTSIGYAEGERASVPASPATTDDEFVDREARGRAGIAPACVDVVRAGVIGTGFIGGVHALAIRSAGATLVAVADSTEERATESARRLGASRAAATAEELIASPDIDVVHICTPNHLHARLAQAALAAGKHVVCEKPLATTYADARRLAETAADAGVVATVPFVYRFYPMVRDARARVAAGESGALRLIHGSYLQDWLSDVDDSNWRVDPRLGGASRTFADIGVHWCDLVEFVTGERIMSLTARLTTAVPERRGDDGLAAVGTEDAAALLFHTDRGTLGSLVVSQVSPGRKNRLAFSIDGAKSSIAFDQEAPETLWIGTRRQTAVIQRGTDAVSPSAQPYTVLPAGHPQGYQDCFNAFVADTYSAIRVEMPDGLPTFADGLRAAAITSAVLDSAASGSWVEVSA